MKPAGYFWEGWKGLLGPFLEPLKHQTQNPDRKHDRYEIAPEDYLKAEKKAKEFCLEIVGVYHSHPDHPDRPSQFDQDRAFEGWSYIILSVSKGKVVSYRSWELIDGKFVEEEILIFGR